MSGVTTFNNRQGDVSLQPVDIASAGGALAISPGLTGIPTAPTALPGTNTNQIATTAFVLAAVASGVSGVGSFNGRTGAVTLQTADITTAGGALSVSPVFTGNPQAPTPALGDGSQSIATTQFVKTALTNFNVPIASATSVGGVKIAPSSNITIQADGTISVAVGAGYTLPAATPSSLGGISVGAGLTVTPQGQLNAVVTSQYVLPQATTSTLGGVIVGSGLSVTGGNLSLNLPIASGLGLGGVKIGANVNIAGDGTISVSPGAGYVLPKSTNAVLGGVIVPTTSGLTVDSNGNLSIATGASSTVCNSFNTRTGAVTLQASDITNAGGATLASPSFSGTPTAPTAAAGDSSLTLANTAFVQNLAHGSITVPLSGTSNVLTAVQVQSGSILILTGTVTAATTVTFPAGATGTYKIILAGVTGVSGTNSLTFQSATAGATSTVVVTSINPGSGAGVTVTVVGSGVYSI
jgi:hypothetical protein